MVDLPPLTYLSMDSVVDGVGQSQVLPYLRGLAERGHKVTLHSFEHATNTDHTIEQPDLAWKPHPFGSAGATGGLQRVARGAAAIARAELVHARSDMAAASALIGRPKTWVWDVRSFWVDQRIALGMVAPGSRTEKVMRAIERRAAAQSAAIITLTDAAIDELARRHGSAVADKATRITTCVDLDRFALAPLPDGPLRLVISGSANVLYDHHAMLAFAVAVQERTPATIDHVRPAPTEWDNDIEAAAGTVRSAPFAEMPAVVASSHAGLSFCRPAAPAVLSGAMPTKIGEFLATGRPVVVTPGIGDLDSLLPTAGAGVVVDDISLKGLGRAADQLLDLLADPALGDRCRALAESRFGLDDGVTRLEQVYGRAVGRR